MEDLSSISSIGTFCYALRMQKLIGLAHATVYVQGEGAGFEALCQFTLGDIVDLMEINLTADR